MIENLGRIFVVTAIALLVGSCGGSSVQVADKSLPFQEEGVPLTPANETMLKGPWCARDRCSENGGCKRFPEESYWGLKQIFVKNRGTLWSVQNENTQQNYTAQVTQSSGDQILVTTIGASSFDFDGNTIRNWGRRYYRIIGPNLLMELGAKGSTYLPSKGGFLNKSSFSGGRIVWEKCRGYIDID